MRFWAYFCCVITYKKILCRFIYGNILQCVEKSLHNSRYTYDIYIFCSMQMQSIKKDQFSFYRLYRLVDKK